MKVKLRVIAGPHLGKEFVFEDHETFLVGRVPDAHLRLSNDDPYFSRRHFVVEVNPPRCRVLDLKSRNGILINGNKLDVADIHDGDQITAGYTIFQVSIDHPPAEKDKTLEKGNSKNQTIDDELTSDFSPSFSSDFTELKSIAGHQIVEEIGRGGMGVIYHAIRDSDSKSVALKTIIPAAGTNPKDVRRFLREAEILSRLNHANVIRFFEFGQSEGILFLTMELVTGTDCAKYLAEKGQMPIRTAVRLMIQVLGGLAHAHSKGYVHRDIKPSNILITHLPNGKKVAKLADFGLARIYEVSQLSGLTMMGEMGGTPAYMAPEQVTHYRDVSPAADQYSAAATLYRLITNKPMHNLTGSVGYKLIVLTTEAPKPIREHRPEIPEELAQIIHRALSREPSDRFGHALDFRQALMSFA